MKSLFFIVCFIVLAGVNPLLAFAVVNLYVYWQFATVIRVHYKRNRPLKTKRK